MQFVKKTRRLAALCLRKVYNGQRRVRLRGAVPTVISRDCAGGILYHDLGLEIVSPTVNLGMPGKDFILFCQHLRAFLDAEVQEAEGREFPMGRLETEYGTVILFFTHYDNFQKASRLWKRRCARVDMENLRLIFHVFPEDLTQQLLEDFEALPYEHKVLLSSGIDCEKYPHGFNLPIYETGARPTLDQYKTPYGIKRHMDAFDWVSFLNGTWNPKK